MGYVLVANQKTYSFRIDGFQNTISKGMRNGFLVLNSQRKIIVQNQLGGGGGGEERERERRVRQRGKCKLDFRNQFSLIGTLFLHQELEFLLIST